MSQELIFTTLPHQRIEVNGNPFLKISVFVSVRLKAIKDTTLASFEDVLNWPDKVLNATFQFRLQNGSVLDAGLEKQKIDSTLYKNIIHKDIRVKGFLQQDFSIKRINSFPVNHVQDFLIKNYLQIAVESPKTLVSADKFIDEERFGMISQFKLNEQEINRMDSPRNLKSFKKASLMIKRPDETRALRTTLSNSRFVPRAIQMQPQSDFAQFRNFHKLDKEPIKKILKPIKKPEFEFHDIFSVTGSYPQLMRKLGFVLDFVIPYGSNIPASGSLFMVPMSLPFADPDTSISSPATAYEISQTGFYTADEKTDPIFKRGFVKINTDEFSVIQVDTDGVALKTHNLAENKVQQVARFFEAKSEFAFTRTLDLKPLQTIDPPEDEGLPYMRTAGIAITKNGMAEHLFAKFKNSLTLQTNLLDKAPLHPVLKLKLPVAPLTSKDITQAYRMDIAYSDAPDKWYSLHQRQDGYSWFDESNREHTIAGIDPDEGYIELGVAEDPDDPEDVFVSETLARWEGWSLSVRKPGMAINESDEYELKSGEHEKRDFVHKDKVREAKKYAFDPNLEFRVNAQSGLVAGTLPKLRFGKEYNIRIRSVDLAGNSVPLSHQTEDPALTLRKNIRYMRYEPLGSPIVLVGNELKDGEFLETLVVRSNFDVSSKEYEKKYPVNGKTFDNFSQRYLLPPKNSQQVAESHGMFEKAFARDPAAVQQIYRIIADHEGLYQQDQKNVEKVYQPSEVEVIYLPDPMAAGVALFLDEGYENTHTQEFKPRMFGFFTKEELSPAKTNGEIPEDWYNAGVICIRLEEGEAGTNWNPANKVFTVYMPKGLRTRIRFSTFWREKDLKRLSAIWELIKGKSPSNLGEIEQLALAGQHWMISPSRTLELIHAVQQPLTEPVIQALIPHREFGETSASINTRFAVHGESTEKVEFQCKWTEPFDDAISVKIKEIQGRNSITDIPVQYLDDVITKGTIPEIPKLEFQKNPHIVFEPRRDLRMQSKADFRVNPQPQAARINTLFKTQSVSYDKLQLDKQAVKINLVNRLQLDIQDFKLDFYKQIALRIEPLVQSFGDTKHRWVDYQLVATSRYREFFGKILKKQASLTPNRESKWIEKVNILSTTRPKTPEIEYVIPTFEWRKTQNDTTIRHQRLGGGLRIFLKRPWYSSGNDEMLGVILQAPPHTGPNIIIAMASTPGYTSYYTHWGLDPLHDSTPPATLGPQPQDFRMNPTVDTDVQYPEAGKARANVVAYPVRFDEDRQLWYCDMAINPGNMYFPFVRLALARYQPHSVHKDDDDVCLSNIVMADMIQLMPDRQSTLVFRKDDTNSRFTISVEGVIYNDLQRNAATSNYIRITVLDSRIAQPIYGSIDDGYNKGKLEKETTLIEINPKEVQNNRFKVSSDFRLPHEFKTAPFQVIIEEYERGPNRTKATQKYQDRYTQEEELDKLVYADVFKINEVKK